MVDRVFLDASVLFSAAYGSPGLAPLWQWGEKRLLLASQYVIEEARRNLADSEQRQRLDGLLADISLVYEQAVVGLCPLDLPDKDRPVWQGAVAARTTHLLTGNARHFGSYYGQQIEGILIVSPAMYLAG